MNAVQQTLPPSSGLDGRLIQWLPLICGALALLLPSYADLWSGLWSSEEQGHGPLILAVVVWLIFTKRRALGEIRSRPQTSLGVGIVLFGLLCFVFGRTQELLLIEVGSHIPLLLGLSLFIGGWGFVRALWFPICFLVFFVPLPGVLVDAVTAPLKQYISLGAEHILYAFGYPIARTGVTLTIGKYQLLVADACSGLHSIYSLSALGTLYVYLVRVNSRLRDALLLLSLVPIAIMANLIRVIFLVLVTYHFGDEAGQGFLHGFAGMVLFIGALLLIFSIDGILALFRRRPS